MQSKGLPPAWWVPLDIAKDLTILNSLNDDTIDPKFGLPPQELASSVEAQQL